VVGLMVRLVLLQEMEAGVDPLRQPQLPYKTVDGADATFRDCARPAGDLVVNVRCVQHRDGPVCSRSVLETTLDLSLPCRQRSPYLPLHCEAETPVFPDLLLSSCLGFYFLLAGSHLAPVTTGRSPLR
jgi:hypothetical protein